MGMFLRAKFEVSSIILTGFRQKGVGGGSSFTPSPTPAPQNKPLKSPPRLSLIITPSHFPFLTDKLLLLSFFTNLTEIRLLFAKWVSDLASSKAGKASTQIMYLIPLLLHCLIKGCTTNMMINRL